MITSAWVDPNGKIYPVSTHCHAKFARDMLGLDNAVSVNAAILKLACCGWLHVGCAPFVSGTKFTDLPDEQYQTVLQLLKLTDGLVKQNLVSYVHS